MPNWVTNYVCARHKTEELIAAFKGKDAHGEEQEITFNAIVPTPPDVFQGDIGQNSPANNWYVFNTEKWGTKWDACDGCISGECVQFNTAWSTPEPIIKELAKLLNDAIICVYADEDIGSNCGAYVYFPDGTKVGIDPVDMFAAYVHYGDEPWSYVRQYLDWNYEEEDEDEEEEDPRIFIVNIPKDD